ncbi:hypothetical protein [Sphingobium sp. HWE2-09]|uniref:hypothetical protein n=1 Tax=Sphingobium sp. HWE2-09 TaxID=3108390 RepID=UPI002DC971B8|nr:hypothetical protein [Sphingobium sp. HWE2-09]
MNGEAARRTRIDESTRLELATLDLEVRARRLQIYRSHLARSIKLASPLLIDACTPQELDEAAWRVKPSPHWPQGPDGRIVVRGWSASSRRYDRQRVNVVNRTSGERFEVMDKLVLRMDRNTAQMVLSSGSLVIMTKQRGGVLYLPRALVESERVDLLGAMLDRAVEHPILVGRAYPIVEVPPPHSRRMTLVRFLAPPVEWRVPWARPWEVPF